MTTTHLDPALACALAHERRRMLDAIRAIAAPLPHAERIAAAVTAPRRARDWVAIIDRTLAFVAGVLAGVLLGLFLVMGWR